MTASGEVIVLVPAYNVGRYIQDCLASLIAQSDPSWRCIVVDDGSTDDTAARVEMIGDPRIRLVQQANAGVSAARNRGLAEADTPFVVFLDGDDRLHPDAIQRLHRAIVDDAGAAAAFGAMRKMLADGRPYPGEKPLTEVRYPSGDVVEAMVRENFLANGGHVMVRTAAARAAGGFDTRLRLSEDWEFWCRLALTGAFTYIGAPPEVFTLRMTPGSASGSLAQDWENHRPAIEAVLNNAQLAARFVPDAWRRLQRQVWASHRWEAGRVNFTLRKFSVARRLMLRSLMEDCRPKRLALFVLAQLSQLCGRSLASRLRFRDEDVAV
jgi:hypothetical protein